MYKKGRAGTGCKIASSTSVGISIPQIFRMGDDRCAFVIQL